MINLALMPKPQMLLIYKKDTCEVVNVLSGAIQKNPKVEDFGYSSAEYGLFDKVPPGYVREAHRYVLRNMGGRVMLLLRPYYLHIVAVSGCEITRAKDANIVASYQAEIPVGQQCVFRVEKRGTSRDEIMPGSDRIKVAIPLGVNVVFPDPPVLTLQNGVGEVTIGAFDFPATLEGHIYPIDDPVNIIDCRLFKHFFLK